MKIPQQVLTVAEHLGALRDEVVFVGGMVRGLLVTEPSVPGFRPTKDVDVIVDVATEVKHAQLSQRLRELGFRTDMSEGAPICRYVLKGMAPGGEDLPVDVMPLDESILGFSNRWYPEAFRTALSIPTASGNIRVLDGAHFVATKLLSFQQRGDNDYYHHDLEDVVVLVDGRPALAEEVARAAPDLRAFVRDAVSDLVGARSFMDTLPGHLPPDAASQARVP